LTATDDRGEDLLVDPITLVVSAVALGAAAGLKDTAAAAVTDAYAALKGLITQRYRDVDVTPVEKKPESEAKRDSLHEDLTEADAGADEELFAAARRVVDQVRAHDDVTGSALGIDLERVQAEFLRVHRVESDGTGVRVRDGTFRGGIEIDDVRAVHGQGGPDRP